MVKRKSIFESTLPASHRNGLNRTRDHRPTTTLYRLSDRRVFPQPPALFPSHDSEILLVSANTIPLRAKADADVRDVYWFAGKTFLGKCSAAEVLSWKSAPGDYELTALDDHGRADSCKVIVR